MEKVLLRPGVRSDHGFVIASFMSAMRHSAWAEGASFNDLAARFCVMLEKWKLLVAAAPDDADTILGWVLYRDNETVAHVLVHRFYQRWLYPEVLLKGAGIAKIFDLVFPNSRLFRFDGYLKNIRPWMAA